MTPCPWCWISKPSSARTMVILEPALPSLRTSIDLRFASSISTGNLDIGRASCVRYNACMVTEGLFSCLRYEGWRRAGWLCWGPSGVSDGRDLLLSIFSEYSASIALNFGLLLICCLSLRCVWLCENCGRRSACERLRGPGTRRDQESANEEGLLLTNVSSLQS